MFVVVYFSQNNKTLKNNLNSLLLFGNVWVALDYKSFIWFYPFAYSH